MKKLSWLVAVALAVVGLPTAALAQSGGTIGGQVVDEATNQPLSNVQIFIPGTSLGTLTNVQGRYTIVNVPAGTAELRATRLGYSSATQTVNVTAGSSTTVNFQLASSAVALDEIVVTGTAGAVQRRAQPAVVSSVDAAGIVERGMAGSVQDLLSSRVPGMQVTQSSGTTGAAQQIRIRGASSISLSNEPLIFIDGVRADSRNQSDASGGGLWVGGQGQSRLFDINPEDIESIEVVKGPAAATLYGADASAGVIQIITKRGRLGTNSFTQNISLEYNNIDPNIDPFTGYARCSDTHVAQEGSLCFGEAVGHIISDNPLARENVFRNGALRALNYNARGGGENYGYFVSLGLDDEDGTLPNNAMVRRTGRANFNFVPNSKVSVDAGFGITDLNSDLPMNDNNVYGFMGVAYLGSPTGVRIDPETGRRTRGTYAGRPFEAVTAIESRSDVVRVTPTLQISYNPFEWFVNRLTVGGDITRQRQYQYFPINTAVWYQGDANTGELEEIRTNNDVVTFDYLGTIRNDLRENISSNLSFGTQIISETYDRVTGTGVGFVTNQNRVIGDAAQISASQGYSANRQVGFIGQWDVGFNDRLFLQLGARVDQHSSFGEQADPFFLPKVGVSYVVSEERFWDQLAGAIPSLRLRAAYGTTGRSPTAGASLETYSARPFAIYDGSTSSAGVVPLNPGNLDLRPERGTEFEAGFDAGFFQDRVALELTYFNKSTTDLLLRRPMPPSIGASGTSANPFVNIGEVKNSGIEYALRGTLVNTPTARWEARISGSTLDNELVSLGDVEPFGTTIRFEEGQPLGFLSTRTIQQLLLNGDERCPVNDAGENVACALVSSSPEYAGQGLPTYEGNFGTTLTLFNMVELSGQLDWKGGFSIYNNTAQFRDRSFGTSELAVRRTEVASQEEVLRRYGPFISVDGDGEVTTVPFSNVNDAYYEKGDFVRLRELAATVYLPADLAGQFGASAASLTIGGRNLALWSDYSGADPEVLSAASAAAPGATGHFLREDFFTVPQPRRLVLRMNVSF